MSETQTGHKRDPRSARRYRMQQQARLAERCFLLNPHRPAAETEARPHTPTNRHRAGQTVDLPLQLSKWRQPATGQGRRVRHPKRARRGPESRLENVRLARVPARRGERRLWLELEPTPTPPRQRSPRTPLASRDPAGAHRRLAATELRTLLPSSEFSAPATGTRSEGGALTSAESLSSRGAPPASLHTASLSRNAAEPLRGGAFAPELHDES